MILVDSMLKRGNEENFFKVLNLKTISILWTVYSTKKILEYSIVFFSGERDYFLK